MTCPVGIWDIPAGDYHDDRLDAEPSLSSSIAHLICAQSPLHAFHQHPRLNPQVERKNATHLDIGTAAHALLLEDRNVIAVVDAPDWKTKRAQEERDQARAAGMVPLLVHQAAEVTAMVAAARDQLAAHRADPPLFADGRAEQTLVWQEGDITCRARLDWLRDDRAAIDDYKTTGRSANPAAYSGRTLYELGRDVQAAFYLRGVRALTGAEAAFRWAIQETTPPYALSVVAPGPAVLALAGKKVEYAIHRWRQCLDSGQWPGFPDEVCYADLPPWEEAAWLEKEERELTA